MPAVSNLNTTPALAVPPLGAVPYKLPTESRITPARGEAPDNGIGLKLIKPPLQLIRYAKSRRKLSVRNR